MKNPLTFEAAAEWAAKQNGSYDYQCYQTCACAQYAERLGVLNWFSKPAGSFFDVMNGIAALTPHTFHNLAENLAEAEEFHRAGMPLKQIETLFLARQSYVTT